MTKLPTFAKVLITTAALAMAASSALSAGNAVIGGSNGDAFWNKIKKGLDDATLAGVELGAR